MYLRGRGVPKDDAQFLAWLQKAAEQRLTLAQVALARVSVRLSCTEGPGSGLGLVSQGRRPG
jgi:TPR repeat protein